MRSPRRTGGVLYIRGLPRAVKAAFRAECTRRGHDMTCVIYGLMRYYIRNKPGGETVKVPKTMRPKHASNFGTFLGEDHDDVS